MRWRLVDRIAEWEPWARIRSLKAISFEEYSLLKRHGRNGAFPECLTLECCVESVRWLVAVSSGFGSVSALTEIGEFRFQREVGPGETLEIAASVKRREGDVLQVACRATSMEREGLVASGTLAVAVSPLGDGFEREIVEGMWREIHGAA